MMMYALRLVFILLILPAVALADHYPKNPKIDIEHYRFQLTLSDATDEIVGEATVSVRFVDAGVSTLRLDLIGKSDSLGGKGMTVTQVLSEGRPVAYRHDHDALYIDLPAASQNEQRSAYTISYHGIPASGLKIAPNKYGDRTFFSDNWPDKGRNWLPLVDHPYDKATSEFLVTAPAQYQVVSNGLLIEETDLKDGNRLTHWKQSVPIASWLYVLGVARMAMQQVDQFEHKAIQTWVYHQDRDKGFYDFAEPTRQVLEFYSAYIGPFVYEKLANIQSNSVSGGMEAASAILYSENSVVGDRNVRWRNVVIHEIAHQWFGNAVTEYDWDDVWLSEGFATYFTLLFIEHQYGRDEFIQGLAASKKTVMEFDGKNPGYRIVHDNLQDMSKVTSIQTYQKGSWILHMLRGIMGDDAFWRGIRLYYHRYMNRNASTDDFRRAMEEAGGLDLKSFFDQWLYKPGFLKVNGTWTYAAKTKEVVIKLEQVQADGSLFRMPLQVGVYSSDGKVLIQTVNLAEKSRTYTILVDFMPTEVVIDPNSWVLIDGAIQKASR